MTPDAKVIPIHERQGREKRRFPRRRFDHNMGILFKGDYSLSRARELSEGGMMINSHLKLSMGDRVVCTILMPGGGFVCARGEILYDRKDGRAAGKGSATNQFTYGIRFTKIEFDQKRAIREYVSAKTAKEEDV